MMDEQNIPPAAYLDDAVPFLRWPRPGEITVMHGVMLPLEQGYGLMAFPSTTAGFYEMAARGLLDG